MDLRGTRGLGFRPRGEHSDCGIQEVEEFGVGCAEFWRIENAERKTRYLINPIRTALAVCDSGSSRLAQTTSMSSARSAAPSTGGSQCWAATAAGEEDGVVRVAAEEEIGGSAAHSVAGRFRVLAVSSDTYTAGAPDGSDFAAVVRGALRTACTCFHAVASCCSDAHSTQAAWNLTWPSCVCEGGVGIGVVGKSALKVLLGRHTWNLCVCK